MRLARVWLASKRPAVGGPAGLLEGLVGGEVHAEVDRVLRLAVDDRDADDPRIYFFSTRFLGSVEKVCREA